MISQARFIATHIAGCNRRYALVRVTAPSGRVIAGRNRNDLRAQMQCSRQDAIIAAGGSQGPTEASAVGRPDAVIAARWNDRCGRLGSMSVSGSRMESPLPARELAKAMRAASPSQERPWLNNTLWRQDGIATDTGKGHIIYKLQMPCLSQHLV